MWIQNPELQNVFENKLTHTTEQKENFQNFPQTLKTQKTKTIFYLSSKVLWKLKWKNKIVKKSCTLLLKILPCRHLRSRSYSSFQKAQCMMFWNVYKETLSVERKPGSGGARRSIDPVVARKVVKSFKQNPGLSDGDRAARYGTTRDTARKYRIRAVYKSFSMIKHPNRSDKQVAIAKSRIRLLYNELTKFKGCLILNDETYVKANFKQLPGRKFYVSQFRGNVPDKFKYIQVDKFAKKFMVWQAICSCGRRSEPFITNQTMTAYLYIKECLKKRLLPFIRSHRVPVKFWPDLATIHYAGKTNRWYEENQVDVIPKVMNPPNCPQFRPIERYWAMVKRILKKNGGSSKDIKNFRQKWKKFSGKVTEATVHQLMSTIKRKLRISLRKHEL